VNHLTRTEIKTKLFSNDNITIQLLLPRTKSSIFVKITDILSSRDTSIFWAQLPLSRNPTEAMKNLKEPVSAFNFYSNYLQDVSPDRAAMADLLFAYESHSRKLSNNLNKKLLVQAEVLGNYGSKSVSDFLAKVEQQFAEKVNDCFGSFICVTQSLMSFAELHKLSLEFRQSCSQQFRIEQSRLGIDGSDPSELDTIRTLQHFLLGSRCRSQKSVTSYVMAYTAASIVAKDTEMAALQMIGLCCSRKALMNFAKTWLHYDKDSKDNKINAKIKATLSQSKFVVSVYDNCQGNMRIIQRGGHTSQFTKGTVQAVVQTSGEDKIPARVVEVPITFVDQQLPSTDGMHHFESIKTPHGKSFP
jgi:hypothetical protein